jgi:hypothetical protein
MTNKIIFINKVRPGAYARAMKTVRRYDPAEDCSDPIENGNVKQNDTKETNFKPGLGDKDLLGLEKILEILGGKNEEPTPKKSNYEKPDHDVLPAPEKIEDGCICSGKKPKDSMHHGLNCPHSPHHKRKLAIQEPTPNPTEPPKKSSEALSPISPKAIDGKLHLYCHEHDEILRNEYTADGRTGFCHKCAKHYLLCTKTMCTHGCIRLKEHGGKHVTINGKEFDDDYWKRA